VQKTSIEWCEMTWNPITGCLRGCRYCYARRQAQRFHGGDFKPAFHPDRLDQPLHRKKPTRIFCGSVTDMFGPWVSYEWIDRILEIIAATPQHTYYVCTKYPENILEKLYQCSMRHSIRTLGQSDSLRNLWIGTTITDVASAALALRTMPDVALCWHTFASIEPLLEQICNHPVSWAQWVIIGAMTGPGSVNHQPDPKWVTNLIEDADDNDQPVFVKNSLSHVSTRQEWPK
jgi:protein gp37